jgi:hypothetical protein
MNMSATAIEKAMINAMVSSITIRFFVISQPRMIGLQTLTIRRSKTNVRFLLNITVTAVESLGVASNLVGAYETLF